MRTVLTPADVRRIDWCRQQLTVLTIHGETLRAWIEAMKLAGDLDAYPADAVMHALTLAASTRDLSNEMHIMLGEIGAHVERTLQ